MKKNIYLILFLLSFQIAYSADNFNLKPILLNYHGITGKDSTIIAYGNYGSYQISYDGDKTWEYKKAFDKGLINKMFIEDDRIVAFTDDGQIAVSYDNAQTWEKKPNIDIMSLEDDIYNYTYITATKKGYAIRKKQNLYFINKDMELAKTLEYPMQDYLFKSGNISGLKTMLYDNGNLIVPIETFGLIFFDDELNQTKFEDLSKYLKFECKDCYFNNNLIADSEYYYFEIYPITYKLKKDFSKYEKINTKDTKYGFSIYSIIANKLLFKSDILAIHYYSLNNYDSLDVYFGFKYYKDGSFDDVATRIFSSPKNMQDYYYNSINDKLYIAQDYNTIRVLSNFSKKDEIAISDISIGQYHNVSQIDFFKAGDYLLSTDRSEGISSLPFSRLKVNSNIFESNMSNYKNNFKLLYNEIFQFYYYNETDSSILLGTRKSFFGENDLFISKDQGANFTLFKHIPDSLFILDFDTDYTQFNFNKKLDCHFLTLQNLHFDAKYNTVANYILLDKNFQKIAKIRDLDFFTRLAYYNDTNNLFVFGKNLLNNRMLLKETNNKGLEWEILKEFDTTSYIIEYKELEFKANKIWAFSIYDSLTKELKIDIFDIENKIFKNIFTKELVPNQRIELKYITFVAAKEKFYLSFFNTLMVSSNIFEDKIKWETFNYPNNGKVNKKFQIFDKTIFARYEDDKNEDNVYWINGIEMVGDPTSVENIEEVAYLYTMPPYPNPTISEVTAKFYWDSRIDIDNSEIGVFDISGNKVSGKENLTLEKLNEWSGNIKWNCANQPKGTYLIKIQHGNNSKTVKVVVN